VSDVGAGGYHWHSEDRVERWVGSRQERSGRRAAAFGEMLDQLATDATAPLKVLDVGGGDGQVTTALLERYPNASSVLIDFSEPMMAKGAEYLARFGDRFRYHKWDMNEGSWPADLEGPFDAVISSAAIHHLQNDRKAWLAREILGRLKPGGVFANYDLFRDPEAVLEEHETHARTCATAGEADGFMADAGYAEVSLTLRTPMPKQKGELALLVGRKAAA
jgi:trans-aconitate methyltransferase